MKNPYTMHGPRWAMSTAAPELKTYYFKLSTSNLPPPSLFIVQTIIEKQGNEYCIVYSNIMHNFSPYIQIYIPFLGKLIPHILHFNDCLSMLFHHQWIIIHCPQILPHNVVVLIRVYTVSMKEFRYSCFFSF